MKPMKRLEKKNKEGFTLIELVIVIALLKDNPLHLISPFIIPTVNIKGAI